MLVVVRHKLKLNPMLIVKQCHKVRTLLQELSVLLQNRWKQSKDLKHLDLARIEPLKLTLHVKKMKSLLLTSSLNKLLMMMKVL